MPLQGRLSIEHMCQLVAVSRRGFYRSLRQREPAEEETEVRSLIQQIALEHRRRYGYRRITAELHRRGVQVNRKKVARMMRDDNLLAIQPKRFVVTTNSKHKCEVHLNPQGSGQNRPCGVTSKPAICDGPGRDPFYPGFS
jgi:putative transposase